MRKPEKTLSTYLALKTRPIKSQSAPSIGQVLHGTYLVTRRIASGGMGVVLEAEHMRLMNKKVVVKVLKPGVLDKHAFARFVREAYLVSSMDHPHIVYVLDFNILDDGQPYMVLEFLEGETLKARIQRQKRLPRGDVLQIVKQAGSALQVLHKQQIVHRDLKPSNIFLLASAGQGIHIKLIDFGISKAWESKASLTDVATIVGSAFFMSPEQAGGLAVDQRTDIFSMAVVAYLCLSGAHPFVGRDLQEVQSNIVGREAMPISRLSPDLPRALDRVFARAMAKNREARYSQVDEFVEQLVEACSGDPKSAAGGSTIPWNTSSADGATMEKRTNVADSSSHRSADVLWPAAMDSSGTASDGHEAHGSSPGKTATLEHSAEPPPIMTASRRRRMLGYLPLLPVVLLAGFLFWWFSRDPEPASDMAMATIPDAAAPRLVARKPEDLQMDARPSPNATPIPERTRLVTLVLSPPNASVFLDGKHRSDNPLRVVSSGQEHVLEATAHGYETKTLRFVANENLTVEVRLQEGDGMSSRAAESRRKVERKRERVRTQVKKRNGDRHPAAKDIWRYEQL